MGVGMLAVVVALRAFVLRGFVKARHFKGRAAFVSFSVDSERDGAIPILESVRWERIGTRLY
jgi:hypothetical protein